MEFAFLAPLFGKYAKVAGYVIIVLVVIGLFFGAKAIYDHKIVAAHDAKQEAATAKADRAADQKAADQKAVDQARVSQEDQQLTEAVSHAQQTHPGVDPATARRLAFHRCLGLQQRARANGLQPPRCV